MPNTFRRYIAGTVGTSAATLYTVPAGTTATTIGANIANITTGNIYVTVKLGALFLVKDVPIPPGTSLSILDGKLIFQAGDVVTVSSNVASSADVVLSVLEVS